MNEFKMYIGPMFGGKTTKLLSAIDRYKYQGKAIYAFKPNIDGRYDKNRIVTHWGGSSSAYRISHGEDVYEFIEDRDNKSFVVAVDEAFMIDGVSDVLLRLYHNGHTILVSSLQLSSDGSPYIETQKMLPYATHIEVCPAVCSICSTDAYYTKKIGGRSDHAIEVGGSEMYQPQCLKHFTGGNNG